MYIRLFDACYIYMQYIYICNICKIINVEDVVDVVYVLHVYFSLLLLPFHQHMPITVYHGEIPFPA